VQLALALVLRLQLQLLSVLPLPLSVWLLFRVSLVELATPNLLVLPKTLLVAVLLAVTRGRMASVHMMSTLLLRQLLVVVVLVVVLLVAKVVGMVTLWALVLSRMPIAMVARTTSTSVAAARRRSLAMLSMPTPAAAVTAWTAGHIMARPFLPAWIRRCRLAP
jgi:hypothetical protein